MDVFNQAFCKYTAIFLIGTVFFMTSVPAQGQTLITSDDLPRHYFKCIEQLSQNHFQALGLDQVAESAKDQDDNIFAWSKGMSAAFLEKAVYGPYYGWILWNVLSFTVVSILQGMQIERLNKPLYLSSLRMKSQGHLQYMINEAIFKKQNLPKGSPEYRSADRNIKNYQKVLAFSDDEFKMHKLKESKLNFRITLGAVVFMTVLAMTFNYLKYRTLEKDTPAPQLTFDSLQRVSNWHEFLTVLSTQDKTSQVHITSMLHTCLEMLEMTPDEIRAGEFKPYFMQL